MSEINSIYRNEIEKIPLLSAEEEKALATEAYSGDKRAQDKLVEANLRFVIKIAGLYKGYMDIDDLIVEGNIGLITAAKKFNPEKGSKFSTYAVWWIRACIQDAIRKTSTGIRFSANKFNEMKEFRRNISSLDKMLGNSRDSEVTLISFVEDENVLSAEEEFCRKETMFQLNSGLKKLNSNELAVIVKRYGLDGEKPVNLSEIGRIMGYSRERIRQIEKTALKKLRQNLAYLDDYVGFAA